MPISRSSIAAAVPDGKVYVAGGSESGISPLSSLSTNQDYDPIADTWRTAMPMPTARSGLVAAAVDGRLISIGGGSAGLAAVTADEVYAGTAPYQVYLPLTLGAFPQ